MSQNPPQRPMTMEEAAAADERILLSLWSELSAPDEYGEWERY